MSRLLLPNHMPFIRPVAVIAEPLLSTKQWLGTGDQEHLNKRQDCKDDDFFFLKMHLTEMRERRNYYFTLV